MAEEFFKPSQDYTAAFYKKDKDYGVPKEHLPLVALLGSYVNFTLGSQDFSRSGGGSTNEAEKAKAGVLSKAAQLKISQTDFVRACMQAGISNRNVIQELSEAMEYPGTVDMFMNLIEAGRNDKTKVAGV